MRRGIIINKNKEDNPLGDKYINTRQRMNELIARYTVHRDNEVKRSNLSVNMTTNEKWEYWE